MPESGGRASCPKCGLVLVEEPAAAPDLFKTVLVGEDSKLMRELLKDGLVAEGLATHVYGAEDGQAFIELYSDHLYRDRTVDLVILDLEMPVLGGAPTAVAMRGMERGCAARSPVIIFFTGHPLTDDLRRLMKLCKPAHYLNKGADASPPRIIKRLREVMRALKM